MLGTSAVVAFVPSIDPSRARAFYEGVLGLRVVGEDPFALVLDANGVTVRVTNVSSVPGFAPMPFTVLGWRVGDVKAAVEGLLRRGVEVERYAHLDQDGLGVWTSPSGTKIAWFKDPDGNVLSVSSA